MGPGETGEAMWVLDASGGVLFGSGLALPPEPVRRVALQASRDDGERSTRSGSVRVFVEAGGGRRVVLLRPVSLALARLTQRQREVAEFAAVGATVTEIAGTLAISAHTVRDHLKAIYFRLEVASRVELARELEGWP